jgi:hypothetical protein
MANALTWVLLALGVVVGAFGGYLKAYLSQKGQNFATHEDIDKLVDQVRAVTTTAKQIEAKISDDVWDRQKRWELKRDLLIDMVKKTAAIQVALQRLYAVRFTNKDSGDTENPVRLEATHRSTSAFNDALTEYDQGKLVVDLVCGLELKRALLYYEKLVSDSAQALMQGDLGAYARGLKELLLKETDIVNAVRNEIGSGPLLPAPKTISPP